MKILGVDHIGIAIKSIANSKRFWCDRLNMKIEKQEEVKEQKVKTFFLSVAGCKIELLEGSGEDSPVSRFISKRGEGIHHIALRVDDLGKAIKELKQGGVQLINERPRYGADGKKIVFLHPKSTGGILIELLEY